VDVAGNGGGTVVIRGGRLILDRGTIFADTLGNVNGKLVAIDAQLSGEATFKNSSLVLADAFGAGHVGGILLKASQVEVSNSAVLGSRAIGGSSGNTGSVEVLADTVRLSNSGRIETRTLGGSSGNGGQVTIQAGNLMIETNSRVRAATSGLGNAGGVQVDAQTVTVSGAGRIDSTTFGTGSGGNIAITASDAVVLGSDSALFANAQGSVLGAGSAGSIVVETNNLTVEGGSQIASATIGPGAGGTIQVTAAETVTLRGTTPD
jgi:large exoprotein involved in heme utilization and adhesion